jgi:arylsulfatase A-like enzyme
MSRALRAGLSAVCLAGALGCGSQALRQDFPNIVLVTLDTTRADHLGAYGYFRDTSPQLDTLAEESIVFERAIAPMATTLPTHLSILTGSYPLEHGVLANLQHGGLRFVPTPGLRSFATICREAGLRTAAFVSAAPLRRDSGARVGFEVFEEPAELAMQRRGNTTTDAALAWLVGLDRQPFFLWVHYYDAHWPFEPPEPFGGSFATDAALETYIAERQIPDASFRTGVAREETRPTVNAYDGDLLYQDAQLGRLLAALRARPDWNHTAVVVVADHGEGLSQHGHAAHGGTWDEQLRVPLLLRIPGEPHRRIDTPVSVVDVIPTLLGRLEAPELHGFLEQASGRDVLAADAAPLPVFAQDSGRMSEAPGYRYALTGARWKYFRNENDGVEPSEELYDLNSDPHELRNVAALYPDVVRTLSEQLAASLAQQKRNREARLDRARPAPRPADPAVVEQLRALGYVDDAAEQEQP